MTTAEKRRERLHSAARWAGFAVVWIAATALLPLPDWLAIGGSAGLPDLSTLVLVLWVMTTVGYVGRAVQQRFETDAPGPDDLDEFDPE
jgi:hypothetical protein